jgi:hypothetical protein
MSNDYEALSDVIASCGSFLALHENTIIFVYQSAKDFLLGEALNEVFPLGIEAEYHAVFLRSLQVILKTLRRDILSIKFPGLSIEEARQLCPNPLAAAQYACVYWVDHLQSGWFSRNGDPNLEEGGCVDVFLRHKYLYWLEALSILGSLSQGIAAMLKLEGLLQVGRYLYIKLSPLLTTELLY